MTVLCGGYEFLVQDYHHFEVGAEVGSAGEAVRYSYYEERTCVQYV